MNLAFTGAAVGLCLSVMSFFASRERRKVKITDGTYRMQRTIIYTCAILALLLIFLTFGLLWQAEFRHGRRGSDAAVPACLGAFSALCAVVWSTYQVRIESDSLRFGLGAKKSLPLKDVKEIRDIRNQGSPRVVLITREGKKIGLWSNLLGYEDLIDKLKAGCPEAGYFLVSARRSSSTK